MRHVRFRGWQADEQLVGDFLIRHSLGDLHRHLTLPLGQQVQFRVSVCHRPGAGHRGRTVRIAVSRRQPMLGVPVLHHLFDESLRRRRRDNRVALIYRANRTQQRLRLGVLEQESGCAGVDSRHHVLVQVERRQDDHAGLARCVSGGRFQRADAAGRFQSVHAGHAHVHQHHIGVQRFGQRHRLGAIARLPDHLYVRLGSDHHCESRSHQFLIVGDDHPNSLQLTHAFHCIQHRRTSPASRPLI